MAEIWDEPTFEVTRAIVLRVGGPIDAKAPATLRRILEDLIDDHGVLDLVVDFSRATGVDHPVTAVLDWAQIRLDEAGGRLELRLPASPTKALAEITADVPSFVAVEEGGLPPVD